MVRQRRTAGAHGSDAGDNDNEGRDSGNATIGDRLHKVAGGRQGGAFPQGNRNHLTYLLAVVLGIAAIGTVGVLFYFHQRHQQRVQDVTKRADLPLASVAGSYDERAWGTYRSHLYFGLRTRHPQSPLFGMMWYKQPREDQITHLPLRHWCNLGDGTVFMWEDHDGMSFGHQNITDSSLELETDWINHEHFWTARVSASESNSNNSYAFVFYFALQDGPKDPATSIEVLHDYDPTTQTYSILQGRSRLFGSFRLELKVDAGSGRRIEAGDFSHLSFESGQHPFNMKLANELVLYSLRRKPNRDLTMVEFQELEKSAVRRIHDFVAVQVNVAAPNKTQFLLSFIDEGDSSPPPPFEEEYNKRLATFRANFSNTFNMASSEEAQTKSLGDKNALERMGRAALSNMLGSIGFWSGNSIVKSEELFKEGEIHPYGPLQLLSAVPSRPTFPRGFIWDEGFHNLLIRQINPALSVDIISSWLDTMNAEGWIPREMVLGSEAEALIPAEYLVQSNSVANPPMFFYLLEKFMNDPNFMVHHGRRVQGWYHRLKLWYVWLRDTQAGQRSGSFRWRGRNATTALELNPKTLPSGLDDFPRASHPSDEKSDANENFSLRSNIKEYHLDLRCWMAMASKVLRRLCENVEDMAWIAEVERDVRAFNDLVSLDKLHWSDSKQAYFDYGMHSTSVELVPVKKPPPNENEVSYQRRVNTPPRLQLVDDVFGYINLFPFLLKLLPIDSPRLGALLGKLNDPALLWTPYGLRSIAKSSPYYAQRNTEHDPPYWRGPIWLNMNYLALEALQHYSKLGGDGGRTGAGEKNARLAEELYAELKRNLVANVLAQYQRTGFLWEHYNDANGAGGGTRPFTGWTALILSVLADKYD